MLPGDGAVVSADSLTLILRGRILALRVWHLVVHPAGGEARADCVRVRSTPCELARHPGNVSLVVQVVGMNGIEEPIGALGARGERQADLRRWLAGCRCGSRSASFAATLELHGAQPGWQERLRTDVDHAARLVSELGRDVAGDDVDRFDGVEIGTEPVQLIEALVDGDAINHVQKAIIGAAHMQQAVVFGCPSRQRSHDVLEATREASNRNQRDRFTADRRPGSRRVRRHRLVDDDFDFGAKVQAERRVDRQCRFDGQRMIRRRPGIQRDAKDVAARRDRREGKPSRRVG